MDRAKIRFTSGRALAPQNKKGYCFVFDFVPVQEESVTPNFLTRFPDPGPPVSRLDPAI